MTDEEISRLPGAQAQASLFEADFKKRVLEWFHENTEQNDNYANYSAGELW